MLEFCADKAARSIDLPANLRNGFKGLIVGLRSNAFRMISLPGLRPQLLWNDILEKK
jgi:hypothetical protein